MIEIPFVKAHGARNDFLLTRREELPRDAGDAAVLARAICDRNTGVGADGWILLAATPDADAAIELWNSDGSRSEISGNGTRCAAALLIDDRLFDSGRTGGEIAISTGAGIKRLKLLQRREVEFHFEMNMGAARIEELHSSIVPGREAVILERGAARSARCLSPTPPGISISTGGTLGAALERHHALPESHQCIFRTGDRSPPLGRSFLGTRRPGDAELGDGVDRRGGGRHGSGEGGKPGAGADSGRPPGPSLAK